MFTPDDHPSENTDLSAQQTFQSDLVWLEGALFDLHQGVCAAAATASDALSLRGMFSILVWDEFLSCLIQID